MFVILHSEIEKSTDDDSQQHHPSPCASKQLFFSRFSPEKECRGNVPANCKCSHHAILTEPIKNGKAVAESIGRKIDPLFPRIHSLNRPAGEHDGVLARTFRWGGRA